MRETKKHEEQLKKELEEQKKAPAPEKVPLLFLNEVNENLDRASVATFKDALKRFKQGQITDIDVFTDEVRTL